MQRSCGKRERLLFKELKKLVGLEAGGGGGGVVVISFSEELDLILRAVERHKCVRAMRAD